MDEPTAATRQHETPETAAQATVGFRAESSETWRLEGEVVLADGWLHIRHAHGGRSSYPRHVVAWVDWK